MVIRASTNVNGKGIFAGDNVSTPDRLGAVFSAAMEESQHYRGPSTPLTLASIGSTPTSIRDDWGEDRFLGRDERLNEEKIQKLWEPIRASGGQCAPAPIDYTQPVIGVDDRPVRDALARFAADRGGVTLIPPPKFAAMSGSYTKWTRANDITPSSPTTKNVLTMTCPDAVTTYVDAHVTAMKVGNFRNLYWPEQVDAWVRLAAVYAARAAEENLLTLIGAGSTNVTHATGLGTSRDVLATLDLAVAGFRNRNRVPDQPLRMIAPLWLLGNIRADLVRQAPGDSGSGTERLATADAEIASWLTKRGITITWSLDGESGQEFGAQTDGALDGWPTNVVIYLFIEGTWLHLDGGSLNLGIIRDSTLVGTNDYLMFGEFMESAAFHGTESLRITIDICPSGKAQALASYDPCAGGS